MTSTLEKKLRGLPGKLKAGIDAGAQLTVSEWAEELGTNENYIRRALTMLRQCHGFHQYHPIGTKKGHNPHQGVIVDIRTKKEYLLETAENQKTIFMKPQYKAFSSWLHSAYQKYPELRHHFKALLSEEMAILTIMDEELKNGN